MPRPLRSTLIALALAAAVLPRASTWAQPPEPPPDPDLAVVLEVKERHRDDLMARPEVHAVGIGRGTDGRPALLVLVDRDLPPPSLPERIEGFEVTVQSTGRFRLSHGAPFCATPCHADQQELPVEMGNSARNSDICQACTLGFKACDLETGRYVYVTNAHCSTGTDRRPAPIDTTTLHVGRLDAPGCWPREIVGTILGHAHPCDPGNDTVDASKIASDYSLTTSSVRDFGWPLASPGAAIVGTAVFKSGRTTGLTTGFISGINMDVDVPDGEYHCDNVVLEDQIYITPSGPPFSMGGDSGSGVFNQAGQPVGLLFAVEDDGVTAVANPIGEVLSALGLTLNLFGCTEDCAFTHAARGIARGVEMLEMAQRLRDEVLPLTPRGRRYLALYEELSPELVGRMLQQPALLERTRRMLVRHRRTLVQLVEGGGHTVTARELDGLERLLADFAAGASPRLRAAIEGLRRDIRDPRVQADFRLRMEG